MNMHTAVLHTPDPEKVTADCDRGLLRIRLPKGQEQERSRRIQIGGGQTIEGQAGSGSQSAIGKEWSTSAANSGEAKQKADSDQKAGNAKV